MSTLVSTVRAMVLSGSTPEQILAVVEAMEELRVDALERRRESDRLRQRDKRERDAANVTSRDPLTVTGGLPLEEKVSPTPPSKTQSPTPPSPPKGGSSPKTEVDFERFWLAYPRKTDKGGARKAYAKALTRISGPDPPGLLLRALERVKPTWDDPRYIPHPTTWLNRERWEDEPETQIIPIRPQHDRPGTDHRKAQFAERLGDIDAAMGAAFGAVGRPGGG